MTKGQSAAIAAHFLHGKKLHGLTGREADVLRLLCSGMQNRRVARALGIHRRTVEYHRNNLYRKAGVNNGMTLVRWAIRQGFIEP